MFQCCLYPLGKLIYEITGGLAGAIMDLLGLLETNNPRVSDIIYATRQAARIGVYSNLLVQSWRNYPNIFLKR